MATACSGLTAVAPFTLVSIRMMKNGNKRPSPGLRWSESEDRVLRSTYPAYGTKETLRRLAARGTPRSAPAIQQRVRRLKLQYSPGGRHDLVYLAEAHPGTTCPWKSYAHRNIVTAAESAGVLTRASVYPFKRMAPAWWVDEYMRELGEKNESIRDVVHSWLTTREVARLFGFSLKSFQTLMAPSCRKKYALHTYLALIPQVIVRQEVDGAYRLGKFWKPEEARREAERYIVRRARKKLRRKRRPSTQTGRKHV